MRSRLIKRKYEDKRTIKLNIAITIFLVVILFFVTTGYALYSQILNMNGSVSFGKIGKFAITDVTLIDYMNVKSDSIPAWTDNSIDLNLVFEYDPNSEYNIYKAVYSITLTNDSFYEYALDFSSYSPVITNSSGNIMDASLITYKIDGYDVGETIKSKESKTFTITLEFVPPDNDIYTVDGNLEPEIIEKPHGSLLAAIADNNIGYLRKSLGENITHFTITVLNSYQIDKEFTLNITNPNFILVDSNGNNLGTSVIGFGQNTDFDIYVKLKNGAKFSTNEITTSINLSYDDNISVNCGSLKIKVDKDSTYEDTTPPIISNVTSSILNASSSDVNNNSIGSIRVTWDVDDENVDHYNVQIYKLENGKETLLHDKTTTNRYYTFDNLADGEYLFKVYGTDASPNKNTASRSDISSASTSSGYCSKSVTSNFKWHYNVVTNLTYVNESNTVKKVNRGYNFTTTITKFDDETGNCGQGRTTYKLPNSITVKMGGYNITSGTSSGQYQYTGNSNSTNGTITVYGVTDDLNITVTGTAS